MCEQEQSLNVISKDGYDYFQIAKDQTKGDRRSDGRLNDDFFYVRQNLSLSSTTCDSANGCIM